MDGSGGATMAVAGPNPMAVGPANDIDDTHCLDPGRYFLVVRDQGDNAQDLRNPYGLTVAAAPEPDGNEPNQDSGSARALTAGSMVTGNISCVGDQDWYSITAGSGQVLRVQLAMDIAGFEPRVRVFDSSETLVVEASNPAATLEATNLNIFRVLPAGGTYYVVVSDDDDVEADPNVPYTLLVELINDLDDNEPNDHPDEATRLSAATCSGGWSGWIEERGTIGSPGDVDWFRLDNSGCGTGIVEAEVQIAAGGLTNEEAWEQQREVQASVSLVRPHTGSPCSDDLICRTLQQTCTTEWDCEGYFNSCLPEELCAGATVCLPGGDCGATEALRAYRPLSVPVPVTGPPPVNRAILSAPLFGDNPVYLRVADFQSDGGNPDAVYTLRVRVRADPDSNEHNNLYANTLVGELPIAESLPRARSIPIHNCTGGDCCGSGNWVTANIGYENDIDWYTFNHPCPGGDCLFRVLYQVDSGPVDLVFFIYSGESEWVSRSFPAGSSGAVGGTGAGGSCIYAYRSHGSDYYVMIRDEAATRDWSSDQTYRFCIEKITNGCAAPCVDYGASGCGQP